jgi:hypothetical protein
MPARRFLDPRSGRGMFVDAGPRSRPTVVLLTVADSCDALTSLRPYRPALSAEEAAAVIEKAIGTQFDPRFARAFLELFRSGSIG